MGGLGTTEDVRWKVIAKYMQEVAATRLGNGGAVWESIDNLSKSRGGAIWMGDEYVPLLAASS